MNIEQRRELHDWAALVAVGRIASSQGRRGEVAIDPLTDSPERFLQIGRVFVEAGAGEKARSYAIEGARIHKGRPVLKLRGVSGIGDARALAGREIRIPASEVRKLPEGSFYHFEMVGLSVEDRSGGRVGVVQEILTTGGTDVLVVRRADGSETLVPLCREICRRIEPERGSIEVETPEGLLDLNAN